MKADNMKGTLTTGRRALGLVEMVARHPHEISFSELAEKMKLSAASLTRLLKMLVEEDWIRQERPNGRYTIGYRTLRLAHALHSFGLHTPLVDGVVSALAHETGHSACIAMFQGDFFVLLSKFEMRNSYHFIDILAPSTDWIDNSMGQFLLAFQPHDVIARIYQRSFGIMVPDEHWRRFDLIRRDKFFVRNEGYVTRIMVGIEGQAEASITSVMAVAALSSEVVDTHEILAQVRRAAAEASRRLLELRELPGEQLCI